MREGVQTENLLGTEKGGPQSASSDEERIIPTTVPLLSIAVVGEDSLWLGDRRSKAPLPPEWKQTEIYWLYPVENAALPPELEKSEWFDPTDCIFELRYGDQYSKVLRLATLSTNVEAKKVRIGVRSFYFVTATEFQKAEEAYSLFLRNEALTQDVSKNISVGTLEEPTQREPRGLKQKSEPAANVKQEAKTEERHSSPKKVIPQKETPIEPLGPSRPVSSAVNIVSPSGKSGLSGSAEATARRILGPSGSVSSWMRYFIVHRGGSPILCQRFTGNSYGYKLIRVVNDGFAVFLFFVLPDAPVARVMTDDIGVPVLESCLLGGEETNFKRRREVLVFTRAVGSRNGAAGRKNEEIEIIPPQRPVKKWTVHPSSVVEEEDDGELEGEENNEGLNHPAPRTTVKRKRATSPPSLGGSFHDSTSRSRGRPRKEANKHAGQNSFHGSVDKSKFPTGGRGQNASGAEATGGNEDVLNSSAVKSTEHSYPSSLHEASPPSPPLSTIGVNMYTDVVGPSSASAAQLAQSHPFCVSSSTSQGLTTSVLPSGVCVTYTAATASKIQRQLSSSADRNGAAGFSSSVGGETDVGSQGSSGSVMSSADAMRGLLENIKLAQEQANALS